MSDGWCTAKGFGHESEKCPFCESVEESDIMEQGCFSCPYWWSDDDSYSFQNNDESARNE